MTETISERGAAPQRRGDELARLALLGVSALSALAALVLMVLNVPALWSLAIAPSGVDTATARETIAGFVEVVAAALAIAITVVAIVVELASNRYTPRITQQFWREPTHAAVLGLLVLTTVTCLWLSAAPDSLASVPGLVLASVVLLVSLCLLLLGPYFFFLFRFLTPRNVIFRIRRNCFSGRPIAAFGRADRTRVVEAVAELEDIARRARQQRDRAIASYAIDALDGLIRESLAARSALPDDWFILDAALSQDPDFVALAPDQSAKIESDRTWLEVKILRQLLSLFEESLSVDRDLGNLIALNTRLLARDFARQHPSMGDLCVTFFNSYLRCAIRGQEMRSAYYVLHQYRAMAEDELSDDRTERAHDIARYMRYYGHLAFETGQNFLLEVVATDLATLIERAGDLAPDQVDLLLDEFLEVDREGAEEDGEAGLRLRGVRRAQIQLATHFLENGDEARARRIWLDMEGEGRGTLQAIRRELESPQPKEYWEFTDRGQNFAYLSPSRRRYLATFYGWFDG